MIDTVLEDDSASMLCDRIASRRAPLGSVSLRGARAKMSLTRFGGQVGVLRTVVA
jgi:hypothetical protein